jgi:hypothetical protein
MKKNQKPCEHMCKHVIIFKHLNIFWNPSEIFFKHVNIFLNRLRFFKISETFSEHMKIFMHTITLSENVNIMFSST